MSKKIPVAYYYDGTLNGKRTYTARDKNEKVLFSVQVHDSGHGAQQAIWAFEEKVLLTGEKMTPSDAKWAEDIKKKYADPVDPTVPVSYRCCRKIRQTQCVCVISTTCPDHGSRCHGSHD